MLSIQKLGATMRQILKYLLQEESDPRTGNRPKLWVSNDVARHHTEIIVESFGEPVTISSRARVINSLKRLENRGLIMERGGTPQYGPFGRQHRYWKLTDKGRVIALQL